MGNAGCYSESGADLPVGFTEIARSDDTITITGVTYEFASKRLLEGVTVSLDEFPEITTVSRPRGEFVLQGVPAWSSVTPRVSARA